MMTDGCVRQCEYYQSNTNFSLATVAKSLFRYCELFAPEKGPAPYDESKLTCDGLCDEMATCYRARGIPMTRAMLKSTCEASCKQLVQRTVIGFFKITVESACASLKQVKMP